MGTGRVEKMTALGGAAGGMAGDPVDWDGRHDALVSLCRGFSAAGWDEDAFVTDSDPRRRTARIELTAPDGGDARRFEQRCQDLRAHIEAVGFRVRDAQVSRDLRQRSWWLVAAGEDDPPPVHPRRGGATATPRRDRPARLPAQPRTG